MKALPVVLGVLALATAIPAWVPASKAKVKEADLTGQLLARDGKEITPDQVASLRVVTWDDSASAANVFEVKREGGSWIIPSHYNYPADGGTRVGKTAGDVRGIVRGRLVTSDSKQYADLGVVDPLNEDKKLLGRGKRIVLKDVTGGILIDVIVGKPVNDSDGMFFVRDANEAAVYTAKVEADITTRFVDWVETDLLKFEAGDVRQITVSDYSVNEQKGSIEERSKTSFTRADANAAWTSDQTPDKKQVMKSTIDGILNQATGLSLTGVRKFSLQWLQATGFFPSDNPTLLARPDALKVNIGNKSYALFGNEGRVDFTTKDGLRYSLLFGEISAEDEQNPSSDATQTKKVDAADEQKTHNRYMSVYVQYDPNLDEDAKKAAEAAKAKAEAPKTNPETPADPNKKEKTPAEILTEAAKAGSEKAMAAQKRFMQFFYVISDANFKAMRPAVDKVFEDKPADQPPAAPGGVTGAIGDALGLPPGTAPTPEPAGPAPTPEPAAPAPTPEPAAPAPTPEPAAPVSEPAAPATPVPAPAAEKPAE